MPKESSERIILLHADSSPSEMRNQLALLRQQMFVVPKEDQATGQKIMEENKINEQVIHLATALMVLKRRELPQKESFRMFLESKRPSKLRGSERKSLRKAFDMGDQEAQSFTQLETPPRKTSPQARQGEVLQSAGAKTSTKLKVEAGDESESDSSDSENEEKQSPTGEVTIPTKLERARCILDELKALSKKTVQVQEIRVEDEVKMLSASFARLTFEEWIAICEYFAYPTASVYEQSKTNLIMKAVDTKLHTVFHASPNSTLAVSHRMIDLFEHCFGRGELAIIKQQKIVSDLVETLGPETVMGTFGQQLTIEFEIVLAHLEHVYGSIQTKPLELTDLLQKLATQVEKYDNILGRKLLRRIADQESSENAVTLSMMLQMIEKGQGMCPLIRGSLGSSRETSLTSEDTKRGKSSKYQANQALSQRKCHICGSESHLQKDCPRGNQQAIDAGKAAAPASGKSKQSSSSESQGEDQNRRGKAQGSGQKGPCQICTTLGLPERVTHSHSMQDCKNMKTLSQKLKSAMKAQKEDKSRHGGKKESDDQSSGQQTVKGSNQATIKSQSEGSNGAVSPGGSQAVVPSTWVFGQFPSTYGPLMPQMYPAVNAPSLMPMSCMAPGMRQANVSQVTAMNPPMTVPGNDATQFSPPQDSRQMQWGPYQSPATINSMMPQANQGEPGPFQSGYSMFPNHLRTSDQGFVMGGVNQSTHSERSSGGESNLSHAAVLAHAEREARIKELLGYNTGGYKAMSGTVQRTSCDETPRDDDVMSEKEGSEQLGLFAAMSNRCPMWILNHIKSADVFPLCSLERQENTRQFIALAASIFNERKEQGEEVQTPDM